MTTSRTEATSVACRMDRHKKCTGRTSNGGNTIAFAASQPCGCDCHTPDTAAYQAYVARHGYQIPR